VCATRAARATQFLWLSVQTCLCFHCAANKLIAQHAPITQCQNSVGMLSQLAIVCHQNQRRARRVLEGEGLDVKVVLLALGPFVAFFATGYFSGFGAVTAEIFPTAIRGTAQGFTYNAGRLASAAAPLVIGSLAASRGFGPAFTVAGAAFFLAAIALYWVPESRNEELDRVGVA